MKDAATLGGDAMDWFTALGNTPYEVYCKIRAEKALGIKDMLSPLQSSYTQSNKVGAPEKDSSELTDEGAETKDSEKNKNTKENK